MITRFTDVPSESILQTDLCIIGAGAAGIALAREYIGRSTNVLLIESGGLDVEPQTEELNVGESSGEHFIGLTHGRRRVFGGTTAAWAGQCLELDSIDFESRAWVPGSGWPFNRDELAPYYRRAEDVFGVSGERYDDHIWKRAGIRPVSFNRNKLRSAFTVYSPTPHLGRLYRNSVHKAANIRLCLGATATNILTNENAKRVSGIEIRGLDGRKATVQARAYVLCTGGIEPTRLLLASRDVSLQGLGNDHDLVGRYFQDHPNCYTAQIYSDRPERLQDLYSLLYRGKTKYWPKIALAEQLQRDNEILNAVATIAFELPKSSAIHVLKEFVRASRRGDYSKLNSESVASIVCGGRDIAGTAFRRFALGRSTLVRPSHIYLQCYLEQAPQRESRITLADNNDVLGVPYARINWKISEMELKTLQVLTETVRSEFSRLDLGTVVPFDWLTHANDNWQTHLTDAYHHSGATRMARDPSQGVVDINCQVHGIAGLYIASGSTFPAAGFANPTLTIAALAIRLGDHLKGAILA